MGREGVTYNFMTSRDDVVAAVGDNVKHDSSKLEWGDLTVR